MVGFSHRSVNRQGGLPEMGGDGPSAEEVD